MATSAQPAIGNFPGAFNQGVGQPPEQPQGITDKNLSDDLALAVWRLLMDMEEQDEIPRRYEIREILKRRLFFRGEQYWWWNADQGMWMPPTQVPAGDLNDFEQPAFQHVTNIIQSTLLGLCSVLSQNTMNTRFYPKKASDEKQVQSAKNASSVVDYVHRNNDWQNRLDECTYFMGTDGFLGSYSRYVSDAEKFGIDEQDVYAAKEQELAPPSVECTNPECEGFSADGTTEETPTCPNCGQPLASIPALTVNVPEKIGTLQLPRGQEVISFVPALQLKRTMWADEQSEFLYMDWITDLHKSKAISVYPDKEQKIAGGAGDTDGGTANTYERIARRLLYLGTGRHTGMVLKDLGTFRRVWIRRAAFKGIAGHDPKEAVPCQRCQLEQLFPDGCHIVFFNDVYCESRNESMDEKWETMQTMPGEGQLRETLISATMPVQEQLNDCINLLFEICMYGVPEGFADQDLIDFEARSKQTANAGNLTPTKQGLGPNTDIRAKLMFTPAVEPSQAMMKYIDMLLNAIPQMLSGYFPALFGGDTGQNDTAAGIAMQRNQAMGRIGRAWRRMQVFVANTDLKAVRCFAKNRQEEVEVPKLSKSGEFESDFLNPQDLQGDMTAYPEVDSQYPTLQSDIRALMTNLYNNAPGNPLTLQVVQQPENLEYIFRTMGANDLEVPGEAQRTKTYKDIDQLLQEQPQQSDAAPAQPPTPDNPQGAPPQDAQFIPSVKPDPDVDDLKVASETCKNWLIENFEVSKTNPMGYENVKAYKKACDMMGKAQQLQALVAAQSLQGQGPLADLGGAEHVQAPPAHGMPPPETAPGPGSQPSTAQPGAGE